MYPSLLARMVNQVGRPAMFEGKRFFPLTGIPIWKIARNRTMLAVWLPDPLTVATCRLKSLTTDFTRVPYEERRPSRLVPGQRKTVRFDSRRVKGGAGWPVQQSAAGATALRPATTPPASPRTR